MAGGERQWVASILTSLTGEVVGRGPAGEGERRGGRSYRAKWLGRQAIAPRTAERADPEHASRPTLALTLTLSQREKGPDFNLRLTEDGRLGERDPAVLRSRTHPLH